MTKNFEIPLSPAIACDPAAIADSDQKQYNLTLQQLIEFVQEIRDLPNGFAFRLPNDTETFLGAAEFVAHERKCCPFFNFTLALDAGGEFWFSLTGSDGVKSFLANELGERLQV